jgi:signal transduction histidine kinase
MNFFKKGLLRRLFLSYLLVIALAGLTFYVTSELSLPIFLDHHLNDMEELQQVPDDWTINAMTEELSAGYRAAHNEAVLWGLGVSVLLASVVSFFMTRQIVAPVKKMEQASKRSAEGRYQERLDAKAPGEIGDLAHSFNNMAEALETIELKRAELIGNVAHEFRTPLSGLRGYIEGYKDKVFDPDDATLDACLKQLSRLEHLIDDLSLLSRVEAGVEKISPQPVVAYRLLEGIKDSFTPSFATKGVDLQLIKNLRDDVQVFADSHRTLQILSNLVANALRHTPLGGHVALWLAVDGDKLVFHVKDTGPGITEENLPHVFTRFYRADKARSESGSGIGLTIARYFVEAQGGNIKVECKMGEGAHFYFTLPLVPQTLTQTESHLSLEPASQPDPYGQKL